MTKIQALADERRTLEREYAADSLEIQRLIAHRFEKWQALQKIEREMKAIGARRES